MQSAIPVDLHSTLHWWHPETKAPFQKTLDCWCLWVSASGSISWLLLLLNSSHLWGGGQDAVVVRKISSTVWVLAKYMSWWSLLEWGTESLSAMKILCGGLWPLTPPCIRTVEERISLQKLSNRECLYTQDKTLRPGPSSSPLLCHSQYHAGCTPAEEHVTEVESAAASIWPGMGTYAVALHCTAAPPSEQRWATWADPRAQSTIREGLERRKPECTRWGTGNLHGWLW